MGSRLRASGATAHRLGLLGVISVVAGVLLAGMLLPIVGGIGLLARTGANDFARLPSELEIGPPPQVSRILAADGSTIANFYFQDRVNVALSHVPDVMQKALIAVEDVRFYEHHGVDYKAALRALLHNGSSGSVQQGGSTLTQQLVKNVLIETAEANGNKKAAAAAHADTLARKVQEAKYALELEHRYSKQQILEDYLNIAYFGDGAYGVGTAARHYFGEPVQRLTLAQSALLAGLVQSPEVYDPATHPSAARARRSTVLSQMLKYHFITQAQFDQANAKPIRLHLHIQGNGCEVSTQPYFCDYVQHVIQNSPAFGRTRADRLRLLNNGGLTIRTTLQPKVERAANKALRNYVHPREPSGVAAAEAVVEPGTGKILAIAVNRPYGQNAAKGENTIDYAVDQKYGGGATGFPAGSTFKLFVLAAALKQGLPLSTTINSPPHIVVSGYTNCAGAPVGEFDVSNAEKNAGGVFNLITGTWDSVNTFFAQLEQRTGICMPVHIAESMGVRQENGSAPSQLPAFTLGAAFHGYSPMDIAGAYATIAAHGRYCAPLAITAVFDSSGKTIPVPKPTCDQVLPSGLADTITNILHGVLTQPGATAAGVGEPGRPAAAKTGTAENNWASVFAGYVPQMAAAVWVGSPKALVPLSFLTIGGRTYGEVFGATIAGPIWRDTLTAALKGVPVIPLPPPDQQFVQGITKPVPDVTGLTVADATSLLKHAGFSVVVASTEVPSEFPKGTVAKTSPSSAAPPGGTVVIFVSNGHAPPTKPQHSQQPSANPSTSPSPTPGSPPPSPSCSPKPHGHGPPKCH
ncbi:MAG: penicillin-binding protein [Frankiales bacterium]|nr:penicillin-binding protein [Frankiales bacterium]